jgi:hypothetical protein
MSSSSSSSSAVTPRSRNNILRVTVTVIAAAYFLFSEDSQLPSMGWNSRSGGLGSASAGGRRAGDFSASSMSGDGGGDGFVWDDSMLYTPKGMSHDSWKLMPKGSLAPLTEEAQTFLYKHQFPADGCAGKKFLISYGNDASAGMGSHLHISGMHLGLAIELGRIFVWGPDVGMAYTDEETCGNGVTTFECFFRAPSSCKLEEIFAAGADTVDARFGLAGDDYKLRFWFTPRVFQDMWVRTLSPMGVHEMKYWWRGQSVAFLARFNDKAVERMRAFRVEEGKVSFIPQKSPWADQNAREFPFRRGTVSLHVRHGDKGIEMELVKDETYFDAAEKMVVDGPIGSIRNAYISTEDPSVIVSAENRSVSDPRWSWLYYKVPRVNSNGLDQLEKLGFPKGLLTHIWWLQLLMALECDGWVGTRGSNWNRLIDELRCIWVPKCHHPYVEVGFEQDWNGYSW